jgi:hypothetical protein
MADTWLFSQSDIYSLTQHIMKTRQKEKAENINESYTERPKKKKKKKDEVGSQGEGGM